MKNDCFIGERLYELRMAKNPPLTKANIADAIGVSAALYGMLENNRRPVSDKMLVQLANFYGVSLSDLTQSSEPYSLIRKALSQLDDSHRQMMTDICKEYTTYLERQADYKHVGIDYMLILLLNNMGITNIPEAKKVDSPNPVRFPYFTYNKDREFLGLNFWYDKNVETNFWQTPRSFYMPIKDIAAMQDDIRHYIIFYICNYLRKHEQCASTTDTKDNGK